MGFILVFPKIFVYLQINLEIIHYVGMFSIENY